jgi:ATP-dependent helicase/nuclease subunit A
MGNESDLLQAPEVETLRSFLQVIHNPSQDIPLIATLTSPVIGFTADELALIRGKNRYVCFYEALKQSDLIKAGEFITLLTALRQEARFLTVSQLIHRIFTVTGMLSIYGTMSDGDSQIRRLQSFCQVATDYEATGRKDLSSFLERLTTLEDKGLSIAGTAPSGAVRIMSIHKSKGLEFPVVFLCGLSRNFNMTDSQKHVLCHKDLGFGLSYTNISQRVRFPTIAKRAIAAKICAESISEELRVLYVAMTRAKDRLIMTYAASKLENDLLELVNRLDMSNRELLTAHVNCPGTWVLMTALQRTEAGELFQISDRPECVRVQDQPWAVHVVQAHVSDKISVNNTQMSFTIDSQTIDKMRKGLSYSYPYTLATSVPSKLTATQLKGRVKDKEAAEFASVFQNRSYDFRQMRKKQGELTGTEYGNALHSAMQYLDFKMCCSEDSIRKDISRMLDARLITEKQANAVNVAKICKFFQNPIGQRLLNCEEVLREFKFSILENADKYYDHVSGEQILLQGVIDCAMIEDDGITVLDFKTDFITQTNLQDKISHYRIQINTYAEALSKIYEKPVLKKYIYFFSSDQLIRVN